MKNTLCKEMPEILLPHAVYARHPTSAQGTRYLSPSTARISSCIYRWQFFKNILATTRCEFPLHSSLCWGAPLAAMDAEGKEIKDPKSGKLLTVVSTTALAGLNDYYWDDTVKAKVAGEEEEEESTDHRNRSISSHSLN